MLCAMLAIKLRVFFEKKNCENVWKISGYMYEFQDLTSISGQISKFQDNAQTWGGC